jgi:DNA-binding CsgD family transcriptional regulator/PAS domain-containing protein
MSLNQQMMSHVIATLYDGVADPSRWPAALGMLCEAAEGSAVTLAMFDNAARSVQVASTSGDPEITGALVSGFAADLSFYAVLEQLSIDVPIELSDVFALHGQHGREAWLESRLYRSWAAPLGLASSLSVVVLKQPGRLGILNIATHQSRRKIDHNDLAMLSVVAPHVRRAVMIGDLFDIAERRTEVFEMLVDALAHPVIVVGADMQVLFANPVAEALLDERRIARLVRGRLAFGSADADRGISAAVAAGHRDEFLLGSAGIDVPLREDLPAVAHVLPLARRPAAVRLASGAAAAIFIAAAGAGAPPAIGAIAALFGLTAAEARVTAMVAEGWTRAEIAKTNGVADGTVKSQLGVIFQKTGTADQRELQLLVRDLTPPVRPH